MNAAGTPLLGLFRSLLSHGLPLGMRDWLDALRALERGAGAPDSAALRRLALALWTRSDDERRLVDAWFGEQPPAPAAVLAELDALLAGNAAPAAVGPAAAPAGTVAAPGRAVPGAAPAAAPEPPTAPAGERVRVALADTQGDTGFALPRVQAQPAIAEAPLLEPPLVVKPREMAVLWRRLRRAARRGAPTELDLPATIRLRCEQGVLRAPVLRARRANSARVLLLADAGAAMAPWRPLLHTLAESLRGGGFDKADVRWFADAPGDDLYRDPALSAAEPAARVMARFEGAALLVVSDAGSARGLLDRRQAVQTRAFVARWAPALGSVVWLNPMPAARWAGTTAALVAADRRITSVALAPGALLRAIDLLRGR